FAVNESAAVEAVLGTEQRQQIVAVALLDRTLDDHEQGVRGRILGDDGFAGAEVGDIQRGTQRLDLLRSQAIERWVAGIDSVVHRIRRGRFWPGRCGPEPRTAKCRRMRSRSRTVPDCQVRPAPTPSGCRASPPTLPATG